MATVLPLLLISIFVTVGICSRRYSRFTRIILLVVSTAIPGLACLLL